MRHIHFEEIDSTNVFLKREYLKFDNLSFVSASYQTSGKGRENRVWNSNQNENALFSFLIKDQALISEYSCLSIYSAMIVAQYLENLGLKNVKIKWPNDVYINDKKICGILLEGSIPNYVVVGVGLNVLQNEFPKDLRHPPTSIFLEKNEKINLTEILENLINKLYSFWLMFKGKEIAYENYIKSHNYLKDKKVKITLNESEIIGIVNDINSDNFLSIKIDEENVKIIDSGEIEIL